MTTRRTIWLVSAILYALFVFWYTDFGGPLSDEEVDNYVEIMRENGVDPEAIAAAEAFGRADSGRQFLMLNNIDLSDNPPDVEGAAPGESAVELMGRYMAHMFPALFSNASHPVIVGPAVFSSMDLVGIDNAEDWDQGGFVRYRSRRALLDIISNPVFFEKHDFKTASLEKTIAFPVEPQIYLGDLRLLIGLLMLALTALVDNFLLSAKLKKIRNDQEGHKS